MSELHLPSRQIAKITKQDDFPDNDLTRDNAEMLTWLLCDNAGVDGYGIELAPRQRFIYHIADRALCLKGIRTNYGPDDLGAFSHGFTVFETMVNIVRGTKYNCPIPLDDASQYSLDKAVRRVAEYLVDTRDERLIMRDSVPSDDPQDETDLAILSELLGFGDDTPDTEDTSGDNPGSDELKYSIVLTHALRNAYEQKLTQLPLGMRDKPNPENIFTSIARAHHRANYPNVFDVQHEISLRRHETLSQQHARFAGAGLALTLQTDG